MLQWAFSRYNVYTIVVVVADKKGQAEGIMVVEGTSVLVVNLFRQCFTTSLFRGYVGFCRRGLYAPVAETLPLFVSCLLSFNLTMTCLSTNMPPTAVRTGFYRYTDILFEW